MSIRTRTALALVVVPAAALLAYLSWLLAVLCDGSYRDCDQVERACVRVVGLSAAAAVSALVTLVTGHRGAARAALTLLLVTAMVFVAERRPVIG